MMGLTRMEALVASLSDSNLAKELAFAEGFAPGDSDEEAAWLTALETETKRRGDSR